MMYGIGMGFGMILWWSLIIGGIAFVVYSFGSGKKGSSKNNQPTDILKERFAKGELTEEEYEQKKQILLK
ncbi:MAG: SHOCT domain-containing protein [Bacillota bacterium]